MSRKNKKKTTFGGILRNIILIAAICVFLFSAYQLVNIYLEYKKGTDEYDKIREYVKEPEAGKEDKKDEPKAKEEEEKKKRKRRGRRRGGGGKRRRRKKKEKEERREG